MDERIFHFDKYATATGLNPEEVSKHSQVVQIFHPESKKYVNVEKSFAKKPENESNFVSVSQYCGGSTIFLLNNIGENEYRIKSVHYEDEEETGFLYVSEHTTSGMIQSSSNVLRSKTIAFKEYLYVFEFIRHSEQKGVYKIRSKANGKVLFVSNDRNSQVRADKEDREKSNQIWFQLDMMTKMDMKVSDAKDSTHFFRGSEEPQIYIDEFANELKYGFNQRFADWHDWLSGCMEKFNVSKKTNLKANKELHVSTWRMSSNTKVNPGQKIIMTSSSCYEFAEKKLEIELNGKKFDGYRFNSYLNTGMNVTDKNTDDASN